MEEDVDTELNPTLSLDKSTWDHLHEDRSLLMIVRGKMRFSRIHEGSFFMVHPQFISEESEMVPRSFPEWFDDVTRIVEHTPTDKEEHFLSQPLEKPNGRVTFPVSGWLTRKLAAWPVRPKDIRVAALMPRDVGSRIWAQFKQASGLTIFVLSIILMLSLIVRVATMPQYEDTTKPKEIVPQPALSLCSADHDKFMEEFRCQIRHFSINQNMDKPFCRDKRPKDSSSMEAKVQVYDSSKDYTNMRPLYCGLKDRLVDGWVPNKNEPLIHFGKLAAVKACFNVLGYPWDYQKPDGLKSGAEEGKTVPYPDKFFEGDLQIKQLTEVVAGLDDNCDSQKDFLEKQISGSIFSTFIGRAAPKKKRTSKFKYRKVTEASELRNHLLSSALFGENKLHKNCFIAGMNNNPYSFRNYAGAFLFDEESDPDQTNLCNRQPLSTDSKSLAWVKLRKQSTKCDLSEGSKARDTESCSLLSQYERARLGTEKGYTRQSVLNDLWQCHVSLTHTDPDKDLKDPSCYYDKKGTMKCPTMWDLYIPIPTRYSVSGLGVDNQIDLDSGLRVLSSTVTKDIIRAKNMGPCWKVLSKRLAQYEPIHPLLTATDEAGWPSEEQQLCGQVCASYFRFQKPDRQRLTDWKTKESDLYKCMSSSEPAKNRSLLSGKGRRNSPRFDRLIIPWNYDKDMEWVKPNYNHVCAFNLVAQGFFPDNFLLKGIAPPVWAGEARPNSKIAGGLDRLRASQLKIQPSGEAAKVAQNLRRYAKDRGRETCGYAAAQCYASLIVDVMGEKSNDPSEWVRKLENAISTTARADKYELHKVRPWCALVQQHLRKSAVEGQLNVTCQKGVEEAETKALESTSKLAKSFGAN